MNAQSFYSRRGYFAVNVQAIVDKKKCVLVQSIMSRGTEHDSTAFKHLSLYKWLLQNNGYYFIGDSAYSLKSFLLVPYNNAVHGTPEDDYNFFTRPAKFQSNVALVRSTCDGGFYGGS